MIVFGISVGSLGIVCSSLSVYAYLQASRTLVAAGVVRGGRLVNGISPDRERTGRRRGALGERSAPVRLRGGSWKMKAREGGAPTFCAARRSVDTPLGMTCANRPIRFQDGCRRAHGRGRGR